MDLSERRATQYLTLSPKKKAFRGGKPLSKFFAWVVDHFASATATEHATVAPTMGLLPMPIKPIIST